MPAQWRVTIYLKSGASLTVEAQDIRLNVNTDTGKLAQFDLANAEGSRLAFVDPAEIAAVVADEITPPGAPQIHVF